MSSVSEQTKSKTPADRSRNCTRHFQNTPLTCRGCLHPLNGGGGSGGGGDSWGEEQPEGVRVGGIAAEEVVSILPAGEQPPASHCRRKNRGEDDGRQPSVCPHTPRHRQNPICPHIALNTHPQHQRISTHPNTFPRTPHCVPPHTPCPHTPSRCPHIPHCVHPQPSVPHPPCCPPLTPTNYCIPIPQCAPIPPMCPPAPQDSPHTPQHAPRPSVYPHTPQCVPTPQNIPMCPHIPVCPPTTRTCPHTHQWGTTYPLSPHPDTSLHPKHVPSHPSAPRLSQTRPH